MNINFINYLKILSIILVAFLLPGGLFCLLNNNKSLVSENNDSLQIINNESVEDIENDENDESDETVKDVKIDEKEDKDKKDIENESQSLTSDGIEKIEDDSIKIKNKLVSWGFANSSGRKIDTIILHSSYDALGDEPYDLNGLIAEYKEYGVASHYLIDRAGDIYRLVADKNIAYHAGVSKVPDGRSGVNSFSIGIEIMNTKTDDYEKEQYQATQELIDYLKKKYNIKYVLGHDEIAPDRKTDPWNFDWNKISIK